MSTVNDVLAATKEAVRLIIDEAEAKSAALRADLAALEQQRAATASQIATVRQQIADLEGPEVAKAQYVQQAVLMLESGATGRPLTPRAALKTFSSPLVVR